MDSEVKGSGSEALLCTVPGNHFLIHIRLRRRGASTDSADCGFAHTFGPIRGEKYPRTHFII